MPKAKPKKSQAQYARDYQVTTRTIRNWTARGYPLDDPDQVARLEAAQKNSRQARRAASLVEIDATGLTEDNLQNPPDLAHAKLYQTILNCRRLAHSLSLDKKRTVSRQEVLAGQARVGSAVRSRLLELPGQMPPQLLGLAEDQIQRVLYDWVCQCLTELSNPHSPLYAA